MKEGCFVDVIVAGSTVTTDFLRRCQPKMSGLFSVLG